MKKLILLMAIVSLPVFANSMNTPTTTPSGSSPAMGADSMNSATLTEEQRMEERRKADSHLGDTRTEEQRRTETTTPHSKKIKTETTEKVE